MTALLDLNVLVALAWPNHIHHVAARAFLKRRRQRGWATCPGTEAGFVRVSSNAKVIPEARTPGEAIHLLARLTATRGHVFWPDEVAFSRSELVAIARLVGYRQVSDAHLLAVALSHGGCLATFDSAIRFLVPDGHDPAVAVQVLP